MANRTAHEDPITAVTQLTEDLKQLRSDMRQLRSAMAHPARNTAYAARDRAAEAVHHGADFVRERPAITAGAAIGLGLLVAGVVYALRD